MKNTANITNHTTESEFETFGKPDDTKLSFSTTDTKET